MQPVLSPIARISSTSAVVSTGPAGTAASSARLSSIGRAPGPDSWISVGATHATGSCARFHAHASWSMRQAVALGDRSHPLEPLAAALDPAGRPERAMVPAREVVAGQHVVVEQAAVVDDARDQPHAVAARGVEHQLAGPRLERVEDHHRPVDPLAEALEAVDQVEREAVGGPGATPSDASQPVGAHGLQRVPDTLARVAGAVGVVQQQQVERVGAAALEAALGRHADVVGVVVRAAQARVGEAREPLGAVALARRRSRARSHRPGSTRRAPRRPARGRAASRPRRRRRRRRSGRSRSRRRGAAAPPAGRRRPARRSA